MTYMDRPYARDLATYRGTLREAEKANAREVWLNVDQWDAMLQCAEKYLTNDDKGPVFIIGRGSKARYFRQKPQPDMPRGTLDLTGAEPVFIPD